MLGETSTDAELLWISNQYGERTVMETSVIMMVTIAVAASVLLIVGALAHKIFTDKYYISQKIETIAVQKNIQFIDSVSSMITDLPLYIRTDGAMQRCVNIKFQNSDEGKTKVTCTVDLEDTIKIESEY